MTCPNPQVLQQLLDETLPTEEQSPVHAHLENCASCQKKLEQLAAGGVTWDKTADNLSDPAPSDEASLFAALHKLEETPTSSDQTQAEPGLASSDKELSFLKPSQKPGSIGRLDKYEILSVIGKGGFGIVVKAFDESLHRVVAIKVLLPHLAAHASARQRFDREAKASAAVTHENVVHIYEVRGDVKVPYLAMQFVSGVTLNEKIDRTGPMPVKEILRIGMQIAEGLAAAHKQGLVHRDIKPGNILLENGIERVKITDFGLARAVDDASVTQSGTVAGTPMYMSPEQANAEAVDPRSDLFSLGSVLYVMCTGRPPFRATSTMAVMKRVIDDVPTPVTQVNSDIPAWLGAIITKLHAKKPEDRFQSAREVADLLAQRLADLQAGRTEPRRAQPPHEPEEPTREIATPAPPRRRRSILAWMGLIALGVAGLWFTFAGIMIVSTPRQNMTPQGQVVGPIVLVGGPCLFLWMIFFASRRRWLRWLSGSVATVLIVATIAAPFVYDRFVPLPPPQGRLLVQTAIKNVRVEVIPVDDPDKKQVFPPQEIIGVLMERPVLAGNWRVVAYDGDKVYYQTEFAVRANETNSVTIPPRIAMEPPVPEPGWVHLLKANNLDGWTPKGFNGWTVKDGVLSGQGRSGNPGWLMSDRVFENYELELEYKLSPKADSGVFLRAWPEGNMYGDEFVEVQLLDNGGHPKLADERKHGGLFRKSAPLEPVPFTADSWHRLRVRNVGSRVEVWMDGVRTADQTVSDIPAKGHIGLQLFPQAVAFRNIRARELEPTPTKEPGWIQLFNGMDMTNWNLGKEPWGTWKVKDGHLVGKGHQAWLLTDRRDFRDFHLRMTAKYVNGTAQVILRGQGERSGLGYWVNMNNERGNMHTGAITTSVDFKAHTTIVREERTKPDTWFDLEVIARGKHFQTLVNGEKALDWIDPAPKNVTEGEIRLYVLGKDAELHVKKIEIKELSPTDHRPAFVRGDWRILNGALEHPTKGKRSLLLFGQPDFADGDFTCEIQREEMGDGVALVARATDLENYYYFEIGSFNNQWHSIYGKEAGTNWRKIVQRKTPPVASDRWVPVRLKLRGETLEGYVDDQLVVSGKDSRRLNGYIGLRTWNEAGKFRNLKFTDPDGKVLWEGSPTIAPEAGWTPLLNGTDLTGWIGGTGKLEWTVEKGVLHAPPAFSGLATKRSDFKDFHLKLEVLANKDTNAFLNIRSEGTHDTGYIITLGGPRDFHPGRIERRTKMGNAMAPTAYPAKEDEWYTLAVIAQGNRVVIKINGQQVMDWTDDANPIFKGAISLHRISEASILQIRNIEIKELPAR